MSVFLQSVLARICRGGILHRSCTRCTSDRLSTAAAAARLGGADAVRRWLRCRQRTPDPRGISVGGSIFPVC